MNLSSVAKELETLGTAYIWSRLLFAVSSLAELGVYGVLASIVAARGL